MGDHYVLTSDVCPACGRLVEARIVDDGTDARGRRRFTEVEPRCSDVLCGAHRTEVLELWRDR